MTKSIYCLVNNEDHAQRIVDHLLAAGFTHEDISVLSPDRSRWENAHWEDEMHRDEIHSDKKRALATEKHTKAPEGGVTGATAGGILGGSLGLLAGIGALAIPGVGPFIAAGPLMAALGGSAVGGSLGLLIGALVGAGIPEYEAKVYEDRLKEGGYILLSVLCRRDEDLNRANDILKKDGAKDISTSRETTKSGY